MTHSDTAVRLGHVEQNQPPDVVIDNLEKLYKNVLLPLINELPGEFNVTCAYRCPRTNKAVGGNENSQHLTGRAADIEYRENGVEKNQVIIDTVHSLHLNFDQMIDEKNLSWVHISYNEGKNREQFLKI